MTSNAKKTLDQAINEIENEWGYEGIKEKMYEIMKPILKDLEILEILKMLIIVEENKRCTLGYGRYHIRIRNDILYDDGFAKGLKERLENDK